jgi:hypothetical protein
MVGPGRPRGNANGYFRPRRCRRRVNPYVGSPATTRRGLYVAATRGRDENILCVVTESTDVTEARDVLESILVTDRADSPATTQRRALAQLASVQAGRAGSTPTPRCPTPDWFPAALANAQRSLLDAQVRETEREARTAQAVAAAAKPTPRWPTCRQRPPAIEAPYETLRLEPSTSGDATLRQSTARHPAPSASAHAPPGPPHRRAAARTRRGPPRTHPPAHHSCGRSPQSSGRRPTRSTRTASDLRDHRPPRGDAPHRRPPPTPRSSPDHLEALGRRPQRAHQRPPHHALAPCSPRRSRAATRRDPSRRPRRNARRPCYPCRRS